MEDYESSWPKHRTRQRIVKDVSVRLRLLRLVVHLGLDCFRGGQFEDAKTLRGNLKEIRVEIDRVVKGNSSR